MKRIAIVGVGPTGIYTFYELVKRVRAAGHHLAEKRRRPGWYAPTVTIIHSSANAGHIAGIEIPIDPRPTCMAAAAESDDWAGGARA